MNTGSVRHKGAAAWRLARCAGVADVQAGIGLAVRHGRRRVCSPSRSDARVFLGVGAAVCVIAALLAGVPTTLSHAWRGFKNPGAAILRDDR